MCWIFFCFTKHLQIFTVDLFVMKLHNKSRDSVLWKILSFGKSEICICDVYKALLVIHKNKSNKMLQTIWHHFSAQFSLLFQMLHSILLAVLPLKTITTDWCKTFNSQSGSIKRMVLKCNTESKTEYTIWKSNEKRTEKWCQIVCSILFDLFHCMTSSAMERWGGYLWEPFGTLICKWEVHRF